MSCLDQGIHYYRSRRYDDAIDFFSSLIGKTESSNISEINLWLGKCFFEKTESYSYTYHLPTGFKSKMGLDFSERIKITTTRKTKIALQYFNSAIKHNNSLAEAHYWKGKVLQYDGEVNDAYRSYVNAARLSKDRRFLNKCAFLFGCHGNLPFLEIRSIDTISIETAIAALSSENAYTRMEGCLALSNQFDKGELAPQIVNQIRLRMSALAGYKLFCSYIPFTGDGDSRIKTIARSILSRTELSPEGCCSCLLENYQIV